MKRLNNPWLNPLQRSYQQIKTKLMDSLDYIKDSNGQPLITDKSEGNIFTIIISLFSAIAEVIHYYIDNMGRETFFSTARRYESLVKHGNLVDYHARSAVASTVDIKVTRPLTSSNLGVKIEIPKDTELKDIMGNTWVTVKDTTWHPNTTMCTLSAIQHEYLGSWLVGTVIPPGNNLSIPVPKLPDGKLYEEGTMTLQIENKDWSLVDTFAYSGMHDRHFMVVTDANHNPIIVFGNGRFGRKPEPNSKITSCSMYVTKGTLGNVPPGTLISLPQIISSSVPDASCSNPVAGGGGTDYETFEMLKEHIPLSVKTLGVAVTKQDFIDLAKLVPGVNKVALEYECGRKLNLYITPDNGTTASEALCTKTYNYIKARSPLATWLSVRSAGTVEIMLDIEVTGKRTYSATDIRNQVMVALLDKYSISNAEIGGKVRISDIYALIDNLSMVDYLHINKFYMKPWPVTMYGNKPLILGQYSLIKARGSMSYIITMDSETAYTIRSVEKGFTQKGTVGTAQTINDLANGFSFTLDVQDNGYKSGFRYSILVAEPNFDYEEPGYNLPIFKSPTQLQMKINEVV